MPGPMIWEIGSASFGIAAALLLIGGGVLIRIQRDRQHFQLMQTALERGITAMPGMLPGWVVSLRQGILTLGLGIGLLATGAALCRMASRIEPAPVVAATTQAVPRGEPLPPGQTSMRERDERRLPSPPPPEMERWHMIQAQRLAGLLGMCGGGVLVLLGCVRIVFASVEKRYVQGNDTQSRSGG